EAHLDQLVSPVAHRDLGRVEIEAPCDGFASGLSGRARVQAKRVGHRRLDRLKYVRRRRHRRFVGVELDPTLTVRRLLAGRVSLKALERPPYDAFRHSRRKVSNARRGLTFCSRYPSVS